MLKKQCYVCQETHPIIKFKEHKHSADGFRETCVMCEKQYQRNYRYKKYGITVQDFDLMFLEQKGKCKICSCSLEYDGRSTHVDHCHTTNLVRGLLCQHCNVLLGMAKDNQLILASAIEYLKESQDD